MTKFKKALKLAKQAAKHSFMNPYTNKKDATPSGINDYYAIKAEGVFDLLKRKKYPTLRGRF